MHIRQLLAEYLQNQPLAKATLVAYQSVVERLLRDVGVGDIDCLSEDIFLRWRQMVTDRASGATWNNYRRHIRALLNYAVLRGYLDHNPITRVRPAAVRHHKKTCDLNDLSRHKQLIGENTHIADRWFWCIVIDTFYYTAMRRAQLVGLKWGDLNYVKRTIRLASATSKTRRAWDIPLDDRLLTGFSVLKTKTESVLGSAVLPEAQIFNITLFNHRYRTRALTADQLTQRLKQLANMTGIPVGAHRLRHTHASQSVNNLILSSGVVPATIKAIQHQLGHTNLSTTLQYVEPNIAQQRNVVASLTDI